MSLGCLSLAPVVKLDASSRDRHFQVLLSVTQGDFGVPALYARLAPSYLKKMPLSPPSSALSVPTPAALPHFARPTQKLTTSSSADAPND